MKSWSLENRVYDTMDSTVSIAALQGRRMGRQMTLARLKLWGIMGISCGNRNRKSTTNFSSRELYNRNRKIEYRHDAVAMRQQMILSFKIFGILTNLRLKWCVYI